MQSTTIKKHVIGIDISNEQTTLAIVDVRGNIIAQSYFPTSTYPDISQFVARLTEPSYRGGDNTGRGARGI